MAESVTPEMRELQQAVYRAGESEGFTFAGRSEWSDFRQVRVGSKDTEGMDLGLAGEMNVPIGADGRPVNRAADRALGEDPSTHLLMVEVIPAMSFNAAGEPVTGYTAWTKVIELTKNRVVATSSSVDEEAIDQLQRERSFEEYMNDPAYRDASAGLILHDTPEAAARAALQRISSGGVVHLPEFAPATNRRIKRFAMVAAALAASALLLGTLLDGGDDAPATAPVAESIAGEPADGATRTGSGLDEDPANASSADGESDLDSDGNGGDVEEEDGDADAGPLSAADGVDEAMEWRKEPLGVLSGTGLNLSDDDDPSPFIELGDDLIYSISRVGPGRTDVRVDIIDTLVTPPGGVLVGPDLSQRYPCGFEDDDTSVQCVGGDLPPGPARIFAMQLGGSVIGDPTITGQSIHSLVLDLDGDPGNDWTPKGDFDWDFFIGTDTWVQVTGEDGADFRASGTGVGPDQQLVDVSLPIMSIVAGDVIAFVVPESVAPPGTGYRMTAFVHDGSFRPEASGGDVTGADPTEPLWVS